MKRNIRKDFRLEPDKETTFRLIGCQAGDSSYEEMSRLFNELETELRELAEPAVLLHYADDSDEVKSCTGTEGSGIFITVMTIGKKTEEKVSEYFREDEYLKGLLLDAMADSCLFRMEEIVRKETKQRSRELGLGIKERVETPSKQIFNLADPEKELNISMNDACMINPVKSMCVAFVLSEEKEECHAEHECSKCMARSCSLRKLIPVLVESGGKWQTVTVRSGESLLEVLQKNDIYLPAYCAGRGTCGKCRVKLIEKNGTSKEVLACNTYPEEFCRISLHTDEEKSFEILSGRKKEGKDEEKDQEYGIAVDIGTTTIAMELVGLTTDRCCDSESKINRQRIFGTDVVSRIEASNSGKKEELHRYILADLQAGINSLLERNQIDRKQLKKIVISANTVMCHLLLGYSCEGLGSYPFTPVNLKTVVMSYKELFGGGRIKAEAVILPGVSAYVGADIVSGLLMCGFYKRKSPSLLIDLGTNGEMAVGNRERIVTTSTAAGPAFEGGNITWGSGSINGAICSVRIKEGIAAVTTIGEKPPLGICGTGVVETMAELVTNGVVDETGLLKEEFFESGYPLAKTESGDTIAFTQKDIRELQMAKAAIRAGIDVLLDHYGCSYEDLDHVYLAGGFGFRLNVEKASVIGLIPEELREKVTAAGNTSLYGARECLLHNSSAETAKELAEMAEEISLGNSEKFQEEYMKAMYFS